MNVDNNMGAHAQGRRPPVLHAHALDVCRGLNSSPCCPSTFAVVFTLLTRNPDHHAHHLICAEGKPPLSDTSYGLEKEVGSSACDTNVEALREAFKVSPCRADL